MIGAQVSHYRVLKKLSDGGMGVIYEGQDLRLGRRVAIKFLPEGDSKSRSVSERFQQEARAASCLNHPNICIVHDVGDLEGRDFIVMELLEGQTLRHLLDRNKLSDERIVELSVQIADGLDCAHSQGIIHRDVKPSNIFVTTRGQAKLLDFGLAKFTSLRRKAGDANAEITEPHLTHPGEFMGTVSYMSPEQSRGQELDPRTDLFSFGVVLYEMATNRLPFRGDTVAMIFDAILNRVPFPPSRLNPQLSAALERIIDKALEKDRNRRYQSAAEMRVDLQRALTRGAACYVSAVPAAVSAAPEGGTGEVVLLYKRNAQPDEEILGYLDGQLRQGGYRVFVDRHLQVGVEWAREIEQRVSEAEAVVILLSSASIGSEMLAYEVQVAHEAFQRKGKPRILPVRINFEGPLPPVLAPFLDGIQYARWHSSGDNQVLADEIAASLQCPPKTYPREVKLETVGGAVPLDSQFYIVRPTDDDFHKAIARNDSIVLIKGARQMGKTSLMARGLQEARRIGARVVLTDFQKLNASQLESVETLFLTLAETIAEQLELDVVPDRTWNPRRGPSLNFDRFLRREILGQLSSPLVWGIDEVDRLFTCSFGSEVFGLFRAWHNERSLDPEGPWQKLTLAIAYATEAHMFITDMNQSPFNVGTRLVLTDFTPEQVAELNRRYGSPLQTQSELDQFFDLVGGHPYLTRRGLHELASHHPKLSDFERDAARDEGPFGDHLRRLLVSLAQEESLCNAVRGMLTGRQASTTETFYRLRSSGLVSGESAREMKARCRLYGLYLERHLL